MDSNLRKRGWSESSINEQNNSSSKNNNKNNKNNNNNNRRRNNSTAHSSSSRRPRANTDHSEDTLTPAEKRELLSSFPSDLNEDEDGSDKEQDLIEMFGDDNDDADDDDINDQPKTKRRKLDLNNDNDNDNDDDDDNDDKKDSDVGKEAESEIDHEREAKLEKAKMKLSKWSLRLFDPNRPRGLVEAPTVIPLNDEFLTQFGQREQELDKVIGRDINIHTENLDDGIAEDKKSDANNDKDTSEKKSDKKSSEGAKVKITNLAYTTSQEKIMRTCERFGPVMQVTLVMDENNAKLSKGRAYVTFETAEGRDSFVDKMNEKSLDGRIIRIAAMTEGKKRNRDSIGGSGGGGLARYWEKDITTKCFRCGQVGHMSSSCPNEEVAKPCPLCAKTGHDSFSCPLSKICFNCGVPGHINRECRERRGIPRRLVCGKCFISGHHRWECREKMRNIPSYNATCFVCGQKGHFMCTKMRWFFGLKGITCFNCGSSSHHGSQCDRPLVENCARNGELVLNEIERASALTLVEEVESNRNRGDRSNNEFGERDNHDRRRERDGHRSRAKSQSQQPRKYNMGGQTSNYGRIKVDKSNEHQRDSRSNTFGGRRGKSNERSNSRNQRSGNRRGYNT